MGISSEKLLSLGQLFNQAGTMYAAPGSSMSEFNNRMNDTFNAQQQAVALRKQKEAEEKKRKSSLFGSIGSTLGTIAGVALAPVTGGASLAIPALAGAAGGAIGGTVGNLVGGGGFNPQQTLMYGAQGAMGGLTAGMFAPAATTTPATTAASKAITSMPTTGPSLIGNPVGSTGARLAINPAAKMASVNSAMSGVEGSLGSAAYTPIANAAPTTTASSGGLFSRIAANPNVQGYMLSQMMPMQGLSSVFQPTNDGFYLNRNAMQNPYNPYGYGV